jgi:hypothetical protein
LSFSSILEQAAAGEGHQPATRTQMGMVADAKETGVHERLGNFMASAETVLFMRGASPKCRAVTHKWIEHHSNALVRSWAHESETQLDGERLLVIRKPAGSAEHAAEDRFRGDTAIGVTAVARGGLGGAEDSRSDSSSDDDDSSSSSSSSSSREEEEQAKGRQLATATHPSHGYQRVKDLSAPCEEQRVHGLISQRKQARAARDFIAADALKQDLERLGVFVDDANGGTWWKVHGIGVDLGASAKQRQLSTNTNGRQAAAATAAVTTAAAALVPENDTVSHPIYRQQQQQQQQQEVGGVLEQLVAFLNNSSATTLTMHGATPKERAFTHKWIEHHPDEVRVLSMPWPGATHSRPWQPVVWY